jgi:putative toxin-antitoxin system antitoxin component (TIGR02293 family)
MGKTDKRALKSGIPRDIFEKPLDLISLTRRGFPFSEFEKILENGPFSLQDWAVFLHLSKRTLERYRKEQRVFDPMHTERILRMVQIMQRGIEVFGKASYFESWLDSRNLALGGIRPFELLDNTFGIELLKDELTRIERGVLA